MGKQVGFSEQAVSHSVDNMESGRSRDSTLSKPRAGRKGQKAPGVRLGLAASMVGAAFLFCAYVLFTTHNTFSIHTVSLSGMHGMHRFGDGTAHTLVIYVYAHTDVEYERNLQYFLEFGVRPNDGCDYLVVVQEGKGVLDTKLPPLPDNVHAVPHPNECYDWGTFGWAIEMRVVDTARYQFIIFLNSSVRGPFLPSYWPRSIHWSQVLTRRITDTTKLVGATISCEGANKGGVLSGEMRRNPHVQSYVVATDQVGLRLLHQDGRVLKCYRSIHDAIWYAEMGSSAAILNAGYNIDSLMLRYQGVDWRDKSHWGCNAGINPYADHMYDGINISPFEVMFVKVKEFLLEAQWATATHAKKYSIWARHKFNLTDNEYTTKKTELRNMKILNMRARGHACFDFEFYKAHNPDLPVWGPETIWEHFVTSGQHEGRVFRFRCKPGAVEFAKPPPSPKPPRPSPPLPPGDTAQAQQAGAQQHANAAEKAATQAAAAAKAAADAAAAAQAAAAALQQHQEGATAGAAAGQAAGAQQQGVASGTAQQAATADASQQASAAGATQQAAAADTARDAAATAQQAAAAGAQQGAAGAAGAQQAEATQAVATAGTVQQAAAEGVAQQAAATGDVAQQQAAATGTQQAAAATEQAAAGGGAAQQAAAATEQAAAAAGAAQQAEAATQQAAAAGAVQQATLAVQQLALAQQAAAVAGAEQR